MKSPFYYIRRLPTFFLNKKLKKICCKFGKNSHVEYPMLIAHSELISVGDNTTIFSYSRLQCYPTFLPLPRIKIGNNCYIGYHFTILAGGDVTIDDWVLIASHVLITSHNHGMDPDSEIAYMNQSLTTSPVHIGKGCWIGENVCILAGVSIGEKSIIGAGSVVPRPIPPHCIAVGNPAKVIKKYNFREHKWE